MKTVVNSLKDMQHYVSWLCACKRVYSQVLIVNVKFDEEQKMLTRKHDAMQSVGGIE